jgi:TRAP-type C4-dicarboxylate transport system substrate-binding protein
MRHAIAIAGIAAATFTAGSSWAQDSVQLKFAIPTPPVSSVSRGLQPWSEEVNKASDGQVQVQLFLGPTVATIFNAYDRVINGVIDMAFGNFGPLASQFPKTAVVTLPFETRTGKESTLAFWRLYENGTIADEYAKVKPTALLTFPGVYLHGKKPIRTMDDMKGLKIAAQGKIVTRAIENLGGTPIATAVAEFYSALQRGTIDYCANAWSALPSFKLDEVTAYHLEVPLGNDDVYVVMNKDFYAKLPARAKAAVDKTTGEPMVRKMIGVIDGANAFARNMVSGKPDHTIAQLAPDEEARWKAKVAPVIDDWVKATPDGARVLAAFRAEVAKIRAEK